MDGDKKPSGTVYEEPGCAYCPPSVQACRQGESDSRGPGFCPSKVCPDR